MTARVGPVKGSGLSHAPASFVFSEVFIQIGAASRTEVKEKSCVRRNESVK
jgi:hypothetical protein